MYLLDKVKLFILGLVLFCSLSVASYTDEFDYFMVIFYTIILLLNLIPIDCKLSKSSQYIQLTLLIINILTILIKKYTIINPRYLINGFIFRFNFLSRIFMVSGSIVAILITLILIIKLEKENLKYIKK